MVGFPAKMLGRETMRVSKFWSVMLVFLFHAPAFGLPVHCAEQPVEGVLTRPSQAVDPVVYPRAIVMFAAARCPFPVRGRPNPESKAESKQNRDKNSKNKPAIMRLVENLHNFPYSQHGSNYTCLPRLLSQPLGDLAHIQRHLADERVEAAELLLVADFFAEV